MAGLGSTESLVGAFNPEIASRSDTDSLIAAGEAAAKLVLPGSSWVHRRVQSLTFTEPDQMSMRLSVDFTVPEGFSTGHVPVTTLPKWPPVNRFDYTDQRGQPVSLLTSEENGLIDNALLKALIADVSPRSMDDATFRSAVERLTTGTETDLSLAFNDFYDHLVGDIADENINRLIDIAAMLTDCTFLWFPTDRTTPGSRTICKLAYRTPIFHYVGPGRRVLQALSWRPGPEYYVQLVHAGADANFHLQIQAPRVLNVRKITPYFFRFVRDGSGSPTEDNQSNSAQMRPRQHISRRGEFAHLYLSGRRPLGVDILVRHAPPRIGFVSSALCAVTFIALLTSVYYHGREWMSNEHALDGAVALLVLVPLLIGYLVVRPSDHPLTRQYIVGIQIAAMASATIPALMGVLLLKYWQHPACLKTSWLWCERSAWLIVGVVFISFLRAGARPKD